MPHLDARVAASNSDIIGLASGAAEEFLFFSVEKQGFWEILKDQEKTFIFFPRS